MYCPPRGKFLSSVGVGLIEVAMLAQALAEGHVAVPQVPTECGDTHTWLEMLRGHWWGNGYIRAHGNAGDEGMERKAIYFSF